MLPSLSLVVGAAASGKSAFAERLAALPGAPCRYIATARVFDDEMRERVERHRARRGAGWETVEAPLDAAGALAAAGPEETVLFDCATLWLTNHILGESDMAAEEDRLLRALAACPAPVVMVSNEVGAGIVPENALSRHFRDAQGRLNQRLAAQAELAVTVVAGLPLVLKGRLPGGLA